jgi:hypothetical protein
VNEMLEHGLVPNLEHSMALDYGFESVRAECAKRHGEEAKGRGNANKYDHFLYYVSRHFTLAKVLISFAALPPSSRTLPHSKSCCMFDAASQFANRFGVTNPRAL